MGISTCVIFVTDEQIQAFKKRPRDAEDLFIGCINFDEEKGCHLHDYWDGLNYLLTGEADEGDLPLGAIKRGDVTYPEDMYAIYHATTKALAQELNTLSERDLRERFDLEKMSKAASGGRALYPGRYWLFPELADDTFRDLMSYFRGLRDFTERAAKNGKGLLFSRYEDL